MRSAAGAYDSGAGGDITKALPLAIDQNANQRHTAPADRAIDRSEYPAHQVITKRGLRTIFFQNADPHAAFADALPVEEYFAHQVVENRKQKENYDGNGGCFQVKCCSQIGRAS